MRAAATVLVSQELIQQLAIQTDPVYQLKLSDRLIEIGPVLGLLLGTRNHWYDHAYLNREPARVKDVYAKTGGLLCAFSPRNVSLADDCAYGLFFNPQRAIWQYGRLPLPSVLHRRSFHNDDAFVQRIRQRDGMHLFNSCRFTKWELYQILSTDPGFHRHLPETALLCGAEPVARMARQHRAVVLKPTDLSRGRGILFVERAGEEFHLIDCRERGRSCSSLMTEAELERWLAENLAGRPYLCQQKLDLATIDGAPFDVRVVMQRSPAGQWVCNGIECRLAGKGNLVTNIAFGGRALWLPEAIRLAFGTKVDPERAKEAVIKTAAHLCRLLDATGESFAEFGIDLAFDQAGNVWFIEANVLPTFHGFQALEPAVYRRILAAPLLYACSLAGFDAGNVTADGLLRGLVE